MLTPKDKEWVTKLLLLSDFQGCEYTFGNNYVWQDFYNIECCRFKDFYLVRNKWGYFYPAGQGSDSELVSAIEFMKKDADSLGKKFKFTTMPKSAKIRLENLYDGNLVFGTNRDFSDYIYNRESLSSLVGKKLHSKRNHLNNFKKHNFSFEEITKENLSFCFEFLNKWGKANNIENDKDKCMEMAAVKKGMEHFFELSFYGGILRVEGEIIALTFGERQNSNTFTTHAEKALTDIQGSYAAINNFFANNLTSYEFINREEDMGSMNLRKAKCSYQPAFLLEKFCAEFK